MASDPTEMNRLYPVADFIEDMSAMAEALEANPSLSVPAWIAERAQALYPDIPNERDRSIWQQNALRYFLRHKAVLDQEGGIVLGGGKSLVPPEVYAALYVVTLNQPTALHLMNLEPGDFLKLVQRQREGWKR